MAYVNTEAVVEYAGNIIEELQTYGENLTDYWESDRNQFILHSDIMELHGAEYDHYSSGLFKVTHCYAILYTSPDYMDKYNCGDGIDISYDYFMDCVRRLGYACEVIVDSQGDIDTYHQEICDLLDGVVVPDEAYTYTENQNENAWVQGESSYPEKEPVNPSQSDDTTTTEPQDTSEPYDDTTTTDSQESSDSEKGWISTGDPVSDIILNGLLWGIRNVRK